MKSSKKQYGIIILMMFLPLISLAQLDSLRTKKSSVDRIVPKATLKFNLSALTNIFRSSLFVSSDIYITKNWVVDVGAGWFFGSVLQEHKGETTNGFRPRVGFKYMFLPQRKVSPYAGVELKFNYIKEKNIETISRFGGQYFEDALIPRNTQTYGAAIRGGIHVIPDRNRRFILDIYTGFGYKYIMISKTLPADAEAFNNFGGSFFDSFERSEGNYHSPDFLFGFSLGYCFH